jgi:hypothetical protein
MYRDTFTFTLTVLILKSVMCAEDDYAQRYWTHELHQADQATQSQNGLVKWGGVEVVSEVVKEMPSLQ